MIEIFSNGKIVALRNGVMSSICLSVTSFSSHTSVAIDLKISTHIPHIVDSKFTAQIFDILSR